MVYMWCTFGVHVVYIWCTCGVHVVYMWCTCEVHVEYMWSTCGVHVVYMWGTCGIHDNTCAHVHRWSILLDHVTEASMLVDDLVSGTEYVFRVSARNLIGMSDHSEEAGPVRLAKRVMVTEFSLEPFESRYDLLDEIGRWV